MKQLQFLIIIELERRKFTDASSITVMSNCVSTKQMKTTYAYFILKNFAYYYIGILFVIFNRR